MEAYQRRRGRAQPYHNRQWNHQGCKVFLVTLCLTIQLLFLRPTLRPTLLTGALPMTGTVNSRKNMYLRTV